MRNSVEYQGLSIEERCRIWSSSIAHSQRSDAPEPRNKNL